MLNEIRCFHNYSVFGFFVASSASLVLGQSWLFIPSRMNTGNGLGLGDEGQQKERVTIFGVFMAIVRMN